MLGSGLLRALKEKIKPKLKTRTPRMQLSSYYDAASTSRRMRTWGTTTPGINTALSASLSNLRSRSRKLRMDNPWVDNGIEAQASNLIGRGLTPRWKTGDKSLNKQLRELWDESALEMDADGVLDFYGQQALAASAVIESGEVFGQIVYENSHSNLLVPLTLRLLESDFCDETHEEYYSRGNIIKMGIELSKATGKRAAYHLFREHPGEAFLTDTSALDTIRVPAKDILHIFKPLRPGQLRGQPWLTTIITRSYQLDEYEDSELKRKAIAAMFAGFAISPAGNPEDVDLPGEATTYTDETTEDVIALEAGTIQHLRQGVEDIKFSAPADVGQTYEVWIKQQLRAIAAGMGVTYEQLTGDLAGVTYTSIRAGLIEFRRRCRMTQRNILIHQFCRPWAARWLDIVVLSDLVNIPDYYQNRRKYVRTVWDADGWDFTDPIKDRKGQQLGMRLGLESREQLVGEQGRDIESLDAEIEEGNKRADKRGLIFDSDPRKTTQSGGFQKEINSEQSISPPNGGKNIQQPPADIRK